MASYSSKVKRDIARWVESGLIEPRTADALARDIEANERRSLSFGSILAMMAALLLGAAILIFVAANWEAIPRLVRVAALFAVIIGGYVGGAFAKMRGHPAVGEALWIVAAAAFGGSIALIGQMYHFSGDESVAMLTWCTGTALAALVLRSGPLTVVAVGIADAWLMTKLLGFGLFRSMDFPHLFLVLAAALFAVSYWTRSQAARHVIVQSVIFYVVTLALDHNLLGMAILLALVSAAVFAVGVFVPVAADNIIKLGGQLPLHGLIGFLTGTALVQFELADSNGFAPAAVAALAGITGAIILAGRQSRGLRWVAYLGFAFELCLIYAVTMETMLGTAGFFLLAAVVLGALAFAIIRIERRMNHPVARETVS
ncbi:hypothetical protein ASD64_17265 [Mesorhizobium sp. Root157]|uniref:DUF2157 domain-containing protein n=1 Tax=Mesorhizobium sp. Root157 TaxID=1736477 RepID=UPI000700AA35|nr:DUF2157 domain-containing protein [Mesorhizobium sp. Root157]KQZ96554.1 hypothetical protein ASD64_17265 [Mesorhizobium sp. Root157]